MVCFIDVLEVVFFGKPQKNFFSGEVQLKFLLGKKGRTGEMNLIALVQSFLY